MVVVSVVVVVAAAAAAVLLRLPATKPYRVFSLGSSEWSSSGMEISESVITKVLEPEAL